MKSVRILEAPTFEAIESSIRNKGNLSVVTLPDSIPDDFSLLEDTSAIRIEPYGLSDTVNGEYHLAGKITSPPALAGRIAILTINFNSTPVSANLIIHD